ncbi:hypothetical protein [Carboxylicivirga caseinilyticus]|uniref:hypothetical protein n=1 Tax=Carboxylicivirga caseinilyticus TaxID=3417572 RepID=UPI003D345E23|nr:hypothetical protein [Marinilabiliaceae bacterium A049]
MNSRNIKLIVFLALLIHGIGHFQGVVASLGVKINKADPAKSWLFKDFSERTNKTICFILFLTTGVLGILTALGFKDILVANESWQTLAVITAFLSTTCLIIFPNGFALFFNKVGAIAVNLFIYYSILFAQKWPTEIFQE